MMQYYKIGGFLLAIEGEQLCAHLASMQSFETFRIISTEGEEPVCEFVETSDEAPDFEQEIYQLKDLDTVRR